MQSPERWWHRATGYQVYPRSFQDSNGDGIGDLPGLTSRLDHLSDLGIGFVWLSPVYASPMADMGYDIADYRAIAPEFGTMEDMDHLIAEARARGIGIVMDLVVNHSSDAHPWFRKARAFRDAPEHDYYIWRDAAPDGGPPDGRRAAFGGPAWTFVPEVGRYYLHLFSPAQPDLNWQNPRLRAEVYDMMTWWLDRGIAGFRMDVISLIGKDVDGGIDEEGPDLHTFLQEMHREALAGRDIVTIGESWSVSLDTALLYCGRDRGELDMVFQFSHIKEGWDEKLGKFRPKPLDIVALKHTLFAWQEALADDGWNSLFLTNHDLPRQVSRYGDDGVYRVRSAKALAMVIHLMKGTPFIYQGEEIGMTNARFDRIDQYRDLETLNHYAEQIEAGVPPQDFIAGANATSRDNSRTPMQWDAGPHAGFTTGAPWIEVNPNFPEINVARDRADPEGVLAFYRDLVALRRDHDVVALGRFEAILPDHPQVVAFLRRHEGTCLAVFVNLGASPAEVEIPQGIQGDGTPLLHTVEARGSLGATERLVPYEGFALLLDKG
ncbi:alpha-glucosidase [Roseivivax isoporae]|uniref:Glucan 1,6-alpha-glucosidase n=1 Tax=Roseivivax isoporae LMG 25204 TaxID=1449351 RepID=X7F2N4_9RHOB|nr:alpha-glucosidase [Roseivivax isoporae]ETX27177.1 glucan 1,6-alpha-glucosidase [Roseivivax isoporae LMG 25204]